MEVLIYFFLGSIFASFINLVRVRGGYRNAIRGRSHCDSCHMELKVIDLIPIISYLVLLGKCRYCKKTIPVSNLISEILTGTLFALSYLLIPPTVLPLFLTISTFIVPIIISDIQSFEIHLDFIGPLIISSFLFAAINFPIQIVYAITFAIPFFLLSKLKRGKLMGDGDFLIALGLGTTLMSYVDLVSAFMLTFWSALLFVFLQLVYKKLRFNEKFIIKGKAAIPLIPFLAFSVYFVNFIDVKIFYF